MNHVNNNVFCPVCGYDGLEDGTVSGEICSSCGTEFGYSDFQRSHGELRNLWINEAHAQWWSRYTRMPMNWSPVIQLRNIGYKCTPSDIHAMTRGSTANVTSIVFTRGLIQVLPRPSRSSSFHVGEVSGLKSSIPSGHYICRVD